MVNPLIWVVAVLKIAHETLSSVIIGIEEFVSRNVNLTAGIFPHM
jgi:hypothetical protein